MRQEIKSRIEEIKRGGVPDGYRKTPVGVFPCDWEEKQLKDLGEFGKGKGIPGNKMIDIGEPCVGYGDIYMKYNYHFENAKSFVDKETALDSVLMKKGVLLFTATGETAEEIGKCVCYNGNEDIYIGGDIITFMPIFEKIFSLFIGYQQNIDFSILAKSKFGQGHSVVHIQKGNLEKLYCIYPKSLAEQKKIAEILMVCDEGIELEEKLIKKLEERKKALMQKLLTPQPHWQKLKLGDICNIKTGKLDVNQMDPNGEYPFFTCSKSVYKIDKYAYDCEALLIAGNGDIGDVKYYKGKFNAYQRTYILSDFTLDIKYVYHYVKYYLGKLVASDLQKSSMPYIKLDFLKNFEINYFTEEQQKIADILSTADEELDSHITKLEKLKSQRKALMQLLLTGIVRVGE